MSKRHFLAASCIAALAFSVAAAAEAADHKVTMSQSLVGGTLTCSVSPEQLAVATGDTITFELAAADSGVTVEARKKPVAGGGMTLKPASGGGPDDDFSPTVGNPQSTKGVTPGTGGGPNATRWRYDVIFKQGAPGRPVLCVIDPVICIKDGDAAEATDPVCP